MGFSLAGSHVVFFVASLIVAGAVSGVLIAVSLDISSDITKKGEQIQEELNTEFTIINDADAIPTQEGNYVFYLLNTGQNALVTSNQTFHLFIDGEIIATADYSFNTESTRARDVCELYITTSAVSAGDHTLRVVSPVAVDNEFIFTI